MVYFSSLCLHLIHLGAHPQPWEHQLQHMDNAHSNGAPIPTKMTPFCICSVSIYLPECKVYIHL